MRVVHLRPMLNERKFVSIGLARRNVLLRDAADTVHSVWQDEAVPMDRRGLGQFIRHQDANVVTLNSFNSWAGGLSVVTPTVDDHTGGEFAFHRFGNEMEFFYSILHHPRQTKSVRRHHWVIIYLCSP